METLRRPHGAPATRGFRGSDQCRQMPMRPTHTTVTIPSRNIVRYFHTLTFPVTILQQRSNRVARSNVSRDELMTLIHAEMVVALGTATRIKRLEEVAPVRVATAAQERTDPFHGGDSNRLTYQDELSSGLLVTPKRYTPEGGWDHWDDELTFTELRAGAYQSQARLERRTARL